MYWFDKYKLLHNEPQPYKSTNSGLYTATYYILTHLVKGANIISENKAQKALSTLKKDGVWYEYADHTSDHWSHDNKTGVEAASYLLNLGFNEGNSWKHLHPRDIIFYGVCNGSYLAKIFLPILAIINIISCIKKYKYRNGEKFVHTDGKILAFLRMCALKDESISMKFSWWACTKIINNSKLFNGWLGVFETYFRYKSHPINVLMRKLGV